MVTRAIVTNVQTNSVGFIVFKIPLIGVAVGMRDLPFPVRFIVLPLSLILGSVRPDLDPKPLSFLALKINLSSINAPIIVLDCFDRVFFGR